MVTLYKSSVWQIDMVDIVDMVIWLRNWLYAFLFGRDFNHGQCFWFYDFKINNVVDIFWAWYTIMQLYFKLSKIWKIIFFSHFNKKLLVNAISHNWDLRGRIWCAQCSIEKKSLCNMKICFKQDVLQFPKTI